MLAPPSLAGCTAGEGVCEVFSVVVSTLWKSWKDVDESATDHKSSCTWTLVLNFFEKSVFQQIWKVLTQWTFANVFHERLFQSIAKCIPVIISPAPLSLPIFPVDYHKFVMYWPQLQTFGLYEFSNLLDFESFGKLPLQLCTSVAICSSLGTRV